MTDCSSGGGIAAAMSCPHTTRQTVAVVPCHFLPLHPSAQLT